MTTMTLGRAGVGSTRRERAAAAPHRHVDMSLLAATLVLALVGVVMVYSATRGPGGPDDPVDRSYLARQGLFVALGFVAMVVVSVVDYRRWARAAPLVHVASLGALALVLSPLGQESKGAQAWFQVGSTQFQPSELGKVALVVVLGAYVARQGGQPQFRHLVVAGVLAAMPMGLILLQPDLGTALVFVAITLGILLVGGARPLHVLVLSALGIAGVLGILNSDVLAEYQQRPADQLPGSPGRRSGNHLQRRPVPDRDRCWRGGRPGPLPGPPDPQRPGPRAADRLHLHGGG